MKSADEKMLQRAAATAQTLINLNDLLKHKNIDPEQVLVLRHRPAAPELRKAMPWLAADRPDVFNAYQQAQSERVERAMLGAKFVASFIGHEAGRALFVGLYTIGSSKPVSPEEFWRIPGNSELKALGMEAFAGETPRRSMLWFDLTLTSIYAEWKGKLIVAWPPPERSWWRRAHKNDMRVVAVREESALDAEMPRWDEISVTWEQLAVLPTRWKASMNEWRAIYYIFDVSDGKGYVGSAYGNTNLLGRWQNYGVVGHGGNVLLKKRNPHNFRFSILQRVSPDMDAADVIRLEGTWKERLHTRAPFGLNDN